MDDTIYRKICDVIDAVKTDDKQLDTDQYAGMIRDALSENNMSTPLGLSKWCVARLKDSRESDEIDRDVSDAVIEREAAKLEVLVFQLASSFVDNEFSEQPYRFTVEPYTARMTGAAWFIVTENNNGVKIDGTDYYSDHEDASAVAERLNKESN